MAPDGLAPDGWSESLSCARAVSSHAHMDSVDGMQGPSCSFEGPSTSRRHARKLSSSMVGRAGCTAQSPLITSKTASKTSFDLCHPAHSMRPLDVLRPWPSSFAARPPPPRHGRANSKSAVGRGGSTSACAVVTGRRINKRERLVDKLFRILDEEEDLPVLAATYEKHIYELGMTAFEQAKLRRKVTAIIRARVKAAVEANNLLDLKNVLADADGTHSAFPFAVEVLESAEVKKGREALELLKKKASESV